MVRLLAVLADPLRWRIVTALATEELCTTHLQDLLGAKQNLALRHLMVLHDADGPSRDRSPTSLPRADTARAPVPGWGTRGSLVAVSTTRARRDSNP